MRHNRNPGLGFLLVGMVVTGAIQTGKALPGNAPFVANNFYPAPGTGRLLTVDLANVGQHNQLTAQAFFHYANVPLQFTIGRGTSSAQFFPIIEHKVMLDSSLAYARYTPWRVFSEWQVALTVPVTLYQTGYEVPAMYQSSVPPPARVGGLEDPRISGKLVIWNTDRWYQDQPRKVDGGVALLGDLTIPLGDSDSYMGTVYPNFRLRAAGDLRWNRLTVAANIGGLFGQQEKILNVFNGMALTYGVGVGVDLWKYATGKFGVLSEVFGTAYSFSAEDTRNSPAEVTVAFTATHAYKEHRFQWILGGGPGVNAGAAVPKGRAYVGFSYAWAPPKKPKPLPAPEPKPEPQPEPKPEPKPVVVVKAKTIVIKEKINFEYDSADLLAESKPILDQVARAMKEDPGIEKVQVEGHTDNVGEASYNDDLSFRRAQSVVNYLVEQGIARELLVPVGFGFSCPLESNDTQAGRDANRRVAFIILQRDGKALSLPQGSGICQTPTRR